MLGKYSKIKATKEATQACSQSKVQIAVSAAKALIPPLFSHITGSGFHLLSLHRLRCETWVECEMANVRLRAGLKRCLVPIQKLVQVMTVAGCPGIESTPETIVHGVEP